MPTQTEKSRQSARLFLSSVTTDNDAAGLVPIRWCPNPPDLIHGGHQGRGRAVPKTETLPTLYQYVGALTRPAWEETRGGESCAADRDATDPVPIYWFPNLPSDEPTQKPGKGRTDCRACRAVHRMVLFSLWLGLFETANPFPFVPICCIIKQKRITVIGGSS